MLAIGVIIQKLVYAYTVGLMIAANLFSIFIFLHYKKEKSIIIITAFIFILLHVNYEFTIGVEIHNVTLDSTKQIEILNEQIPELKNEKVLYIGNGLSSYYIKANSYTNYTTTIFLDNTNPTYLNSAYINNLRNKIKNYTGKYIILDKDEFEIKKRISDDIIEFILNNYHYKLDTQINVCEYEIDDGWHIVIYEKNDPI